MIKETIDKADFIKSKNLDSTKDTVKKISIQVADWEKIFATCLSV